MHRPTLMSKSKSSLFASFFMLAVMVSVGSPTAPGMESEPSKAKVPPMDPVQSRSAKASLAPAKVPQSVPVQLNFNKI